MSDTLFDEGSSPSRPGAPLAVRLRPRGLDELVGQGSLLEPGAPLRRLIEGDTGPATASVVLWGPPGTGKTTLASLAATASGRRFVELSAVTAGVKDVRDVIDSARRDLGMSGRGTVLFVDEVHRFSKTQQDALLPAVENGWVTLIAATTENPSFSVIAPLLSRSLLLRLESLTDADLRVLMARAVADPRGLDSQVTLDDEAQDHLLRVAGGDARRLLTALEAAAGVALSENADSDLTGVSPVVTLAHVERAVDRAAVRYDRDGDQHYDVISAFIKSIRGSDVDAGMHYLARMLEAGEDPRFIARRLVILASEDVGMADPTALQTALAAMQAVALIGMPEARIVLAQAVVHLAVAPKSNAAYVAIDEAIADVRAGHAAAVPVHLRDASYPGARGLGHGAGYLYAHDAPGGVAAQRYLPDDLVGRSYYRPTDRGFESRVTDVLARLREGLGSETRGPNDGEPTDESEGP